MNRFLQTIFIASILNILFVFGLSAQCLTEGGTVVHATTPASCNGASDGVLSVTFTDGSYAYSAYTYSLIDKFTSQPVSVPYGTAVGTLSGGKLTFTGVPAGLYIVQAVKPAPGKCLVNIRFLTGIEVTEPDELVVKTVSTTAACSGGNSGSIDISVSGGNSGGYTYNWTGGLPAQQDHTGTVAAGSYDVTVTDTKGCTATLTGITVAPQPTAAISGDNAICSGSSTTLNFALTGTAPWQITYMVNGANPVTLSGIATSPFTVSVSPTSTATYTLQSVKDANCSTGGVSGSANVTVNPLPTTPIITAGGPTTFCGGGSVTLTSSAATSYLWSTGATTQAITVSAAGSYTVTVTDVNGCKATSAATTVTVNPLPVLAITDPAAVCSPATVNLTAAAVTAGSTGGGTLTYYATMADATASTNALASASAVATSGTYYIKSTTGAGCTDIKPVTVTINPLPTTPIITAGGPTTFCGGGSVTLTASSATSYLWSTGATTQAITVSTAGSYTVTVTDANGCKATSAATTVTVNPLPVLAITDPAAVCSPATVNLTAAAVTAGSTGGGTLSYYATMADATAGTNALASASAVASSGTYYIKSTTGAGCTDIKPVTVTINPLPTTPIITAGGPTTFCSGGSVTLTASSATSYLWSTGETAQSITVSTAGSYTVTVTDANGCKATSAATTVTVNPLPTSTITAGGPTTFCGGGSVILTASNATSYAWSTGETAQSITVSTGGNYTVTVTDANGCSATSAATTVTVNPLPVLAITDPAAVCSPATVNLTAAAVTAGSTGGGTLTYYATMADATAGTNAISASAIATSGTYYIKSTTGAGCTDIKPVTATINAQPATPTLSAFTPACSDVATVTLSGGAPTGGVYSGTGVSFNGTDYVFATSAGTQTITYTVTNVSGCSNATSRVLTVNPAPVATFAYAGPYCVNGGTNPSPTFSGGAIAGTLSSTAGLSINSATGTINLAASTAGTYTVTNTVTQNGCTSTATASVTINAAPMATFSYAGPYCVNGATNPSPTLTGTAGTFSSTAGLSIDATTGTINLAASTAGTYTVTNKVTANGCTSTATASVTINVAPVATFSYAGPYCINGGTNPSPSFSGGGFSGTFSSTAGLSISSTTGTIDLAASTAGTYVVTNTVTQNGCTSTATASVTINVAPVATFSYAGPYCINGGTNPSPSFSGGGFSGTFSSTAGLSIDANTGTINLAASTAGTYTVTNKVTANGCTSTATANVTINVAPVATFSYAGPYCINGGTNPSPTFSGFSGIFSSTAGLSLDANTGTINLAASTAGTYVVTNTVTQNGCTSTATANVTINAAPVATFSYAGPYCVNGATNPSPTLTGTAGTFSSTAGLSINAITGTINLAASTAGTYTVTNTVTQNGCTSTATTNVTINVAPVATFSYAGPYCMNLGTNPSPSFSGGGVAGTFSSAAGLSIDAATGTIDLVASTAGTYTVTNTVAQNGCTSTATASVTINAAPVATFSYAGPYCVNGATNPSPTLTGTAGTFSSTAGLSINSATGTINLAGSTAGTYTVTNTIAASNGCQVVIATANVTINAAPVATFAYAGPYCVNAGSNPLPTFSGGAVAGTFSSTAGLSIDANTGTINLAASTAGTYVVTNTVTQNGCTSTATANVTITAAPVATFAYAGPYCVNGATNPSPTLTGTAGTFSSTAGLSINATTGAIDLAASTAGTYIVTNTIAAANGCQSVSATASVTINVAPVATFSYAGPYCVNAGSNPLPTFSGGAIAGTLSSTAGLSISSTTGTINLAASTAGTYVVTNTVTQNGCIATATASVTINAAPVATFSYAGPYCVNGATNPSPTLTGTAGTFSSTAGLSIDSNTGTINLAASTAGTYTVTNTVTQNGCTSTATTSVTINAQPATPTLAAFAPVCSDVATVTLSGGAPTGGVYSGTGVSLVGSNYVFSTSAGTQTITYTVTNAGCSSSTSATLTVTPAPVAAFSYVGTPFCASDPNPLPTFTSGSQTGGTFSASSTQLMINPATGELDLANSTAGTYTVSYSVTTNGCTTVATTSIRIKTSPHANFSYTGTPYCQGGTDPSPTFSQSGTAGTFTASPAGLTISPITGKITLASSTPGTYTVTNTVTGNGNGGCDAISIATITINAAPAVPTITASGATTFCQGDSVTLTSSAASGNVWSNNATTQSITVSTAGNYTVTVTSNGCSATSAATKVTVTPAPSAPTVTSPLAYCQGATATATALTATGTNLKWYTAATGGTGVATIIPTTTSTGSTDYYVSQTVGSCESPRTKLTVTVSPAPVLAITDPTAVCSPATVNLTAAAVTAGSTGAGTLSYWTDAAATIALTSPSNVAISGVYYIKSTANGCSDIKAVNVTIHSIALSATTVNASSCNATGGSIDLTVTGTNAPYTYAWSDGGSFSAPTEDITGVAAGTYTVTVTDAGGCTATLSRTITSSPALVVSATAANSTNCTAANGSITLTVSGGAAPYTYLWSNSDTTKNLTNLPAGTYSVTVTDANGCTATASQTVVDPTGITLSINSIDVSDCATPDGAVAVSVSGGKSPYTYLWNTGATTQSLSGLTAGTYTVFVTDNNGCFATLSKTITDPNAIVLSSTVVNSTNCTSANGSITVNITSGGVAPFTYLWNTGATGSSISNLAAGTYSVTVTDANDCKSTISSVITDPAAIVLSAGTTNSTNCTTPTGKIDLSIVSGGQVPFTYLWNNNATTQDLTNVAAGVYTVVVTDANGCTATLTRAISDPSGIGLSASAKNVTDCTTANGSITLTVTGGNGTLTYVWSNGKTTKDISGLSAGIYTVTVKDGNGCQATLSQTITSPSTLVLTASVTDVNGCASANGAIDLTVAGGTAPYSYNWNNGTYVTQDLTNLIAGTYTVVVTDASGCKVTLSRTLVSPVALVATATTVNSTDCKVPNGKITLNVSGGTAPYTYVWSGSASTQDNLSGLSAGTYSVTVTDANGCSTLVTGTIQDPANIQLTPIVVNSTDCTSPNGSISLNITGGLAPYTYAWSTGVSNSTLSGLAAGTYTATVTDQNGCKATISIVVTDSCTPTCTLAAMTVATNSTSCTSPDGQIDLTVTGGTAPFSYSWSNNATGEDLTSLAAGIYTVTITDATGCTATASATITDPAGIKLTTVITNVSDCKTPNGAIDLTIVGGTAPYTVFWNTGATAEDLTKLSAGTYVVNVTDVNGCSATLSVKVKDPAGMILAASASNSTDCAIPDGSISVTVTGGVSPYTYQWATGEQTSNITNLSAGTYSVTVTDANGCAATLSTQITDPSGMTLTAVVTNSSSCTKPDGSIVLSLSGGVTPYSYAWSNGTGFTSTQSDIVGLAAGTYTVVVTDGDKCKVTLTRTISDPGAITLAATAVNSTSCTTPNGSITLTATGTGLTYKWSGPSFTATTKDISGLAAGTYTVIVKNANGCQATLSSTITNPTAPVAPTVTSPVAYCQGAAPTALTATASTGATLQWYTVATGGTASTTAPTPSTASVGTVNYYVSQLLSGCESARTLIAVNVTATSPAPTAVSPAAVCSGSATPTLTATSTGINPVFTWYKEAALTTQLSTTANFTPIATDLDMNVAGTTTFYVTQDIGCGQSAATAVVVTVKAATDPTCSTPPVCTLTANAGADQPNVCGVTTNLAATALTGSATGVWSKVSGAGNVTFGTATSATSSITVDQAGTYVLRWLVTEGTCTASDSVSLTFNTVSPAPVAASPSALCVGSAIPTLTATGTSLKWYKEAALTTQLSTSASFTPASADLNMSVAGVTTFYVTQTTSCGVSAATAVTVTVSNSLAASVSISASATTVCTGTAITFTATPTNGGSAPTYQWKVNNSDVAGANASTFTSSSLANNDQVSVVMTAGGTGTGCISGSPATSNAVAIIITNSLTPSVSITASATTICTGTAVTFTATATNGGTAPTYQWQVNGTSVAGTTSATFTSSTLNNNDVVTVSLTPDVSGAGSCINPAAVSSNSVTITIANNLVATVSIAASQTTVCAGTAITFTATPANGGSTPTYQWKVNGTDVSGATSASFTSSSLNNNDQVTVEMTAGGTGISCISGSPATSNAVAIVVTNSLAPSVSVSASQTTVCANTAITFTATPTNGGTAPAYQWSVNGTPVTGATSSTFTSSTLSNNAQVTVAMTPDISGSGSCINPAAVVSNQVTITISNSLTASVSIAASATTVCANTSIIFTATPTNGGSAPTYQWQVNGTDVSGATSATFTSSTLANNDKVTVVMTAAGSGLGCISGSPATSNEVAITISNSLTASVSITASQTTVCAGTAITFTATPTNGGSTPTYQWSVNGTPVTGATASTFTTSTLGNNDQVRVIMTAGGTGTSCITGSPATSNSLTITTTNSLTPSVTVAASQTTVCAGTAITFTATATNGGTTPTYQWQVNGTDVSGATNATFTTSTLANNDQVTVSVKPDVSGSGSCINPALVTSNSVVITISNSLTASVSVSASATTICTGTAVTFTATPTNGGSAPTYQWLVNNAPVSGASSATFTSTTLNTNDQVTVTMTAGGSGTSCIAGSPATSSPVTITIANSLTASVSISASATTVCTGTAITFTATPTNGGSAPTYQWKVNNSDVAGANASTFTSTTLANSDKVSVVMTAGGTGIGCISGSPATSNSVAIIITNSLTPSVSITASQTAACPATSITFTATANNGGTTPTYQWQVNGVDVANATAATFTSSTLTNTDKVTVVMTPDVSGSGSCINPAKVTSNQVVMTISNSLPASVSISASATTVCTGTAITFTATPTNGGTAPTYSWLVNGTSTGATGVTFTSSTLTNNDKVSVVMIAGGTGISCITGSPAISNQLTITISTNLAASVSIAASQTAACPNTAITFTATPTNGGTAPTYQWRVNGTNVNGATSATFTASTLANNDQVSVIMTAGGTGTSCISGSPATSAPITMTISNNLTPTVSMVASATGPFCSGSSVSFTATATNGGTAPTYQWKVNGTSVNGATSATFTSATLNNNDVVTVSLTPDVSGAGSCINPAAVSSNSVTVSVKPSTDPSCGCNLDINVSSNPVTCQSGSDGEAIAIVLSGSSAGINEYLFSLNGGTPESVNNFFKKFLNQPAGPFSITVTDRNNTTCTATGSNVIGSKVSMITPVIPINPSCGSADGQIDFEAFQTTGTKKPFRISIDGGKTFFATATGDTTFSNLAAGTYNIVISDGTPCSVALAVTLKSSGTTSPAPSAATPAALCSGSAIPTLTATGTTLKWYATSALGTVVGTGASFTPTASQLNMNVAGTTTFYVTQDLGCGQSAATAVVVTVKAATDPTCSTPPVCTLTANAGADQPGVCPLTSTLAATAPTGSATGVWSKVSGAGNVTFGTATSATSSITVDQAGTYVLRWLVTEGTCTASDSVSLTFNTVSPAPVAASPSALCVGSAIPTLTATGTSLKWYKEAALTTQLSTSASFTPASADLNMSVAGVTTFYVTQTTSCGVSAATAVTVTVSNSLAASVSISASASTVCTGTAITFTATPTNGGSAPTYQWLVNGVSANATGATFTSSTLKDNDQVNVIMTAGGTGIGCITGSPATSNSVRITIASSLTPSASVKASQTTACPNTAITFTATASNGGSAPTYQWQVNGTSVVGATSATFTSSTLANNDKVTVVMTAGGTGTGCLTSTTATSSPITMTISNNIQPTVSIVASATGPFCAGSSISFTATASNAGVAPKYQWQVNGTDVNGANTATFTTSTLANTDKVTVKVTPDVSGAGSCIQAAVVTSNQVAVTIKPNTDPTCQCNFVAKAYSNSVTCQGDSDGEAFAIVLKGGSGQFSYSLNGGPAVSAAEVFKEFANQPQGKFTIKITDLNNTNCSQTVTDSISAYVTLVTPVKYTDPTCKGNDGKIDFDAFKTGVGAGKAPYNISIDGGKTFTSTTTGDLTFDNLASGTYNIVISDGTPCTTSFSIKLDNSSLITPSVSIATTNATVCASTSATFTATPTNGGSAPTYQWKVNGVNVTGATSATFASSTLITGDIVSVEMKADVSGTTNCISAVAVASNTISVTVKPANDPTCNCIVATVAKSDVSCNGQNDGTISISAVSGGDAATYQYAITGPVNDAGKQLFTGLKPGTYTVTVKDGQGTCQFSVDVTITEPTRQSLTLVVTDPAAICAPARVDLTAAAVTAGSSTGTTLTYWTDATAVTPLATPSAITTSGTYFIKSSNGGCSSIQPVKVVINAAPSLVISNPTGDCANPVVDLTAATITAGSTGGTFTYWTNASATTPVATPNAVTVSGTYYIKSTNASGCFDIKPVVVTTSPTFEVRITAEAGCSEKGGVVVVENVQGGKAPYRYSLNDVTYQTSPDFTNLASGSYTMYVKDADQRKLCAQTFVIEGARPITYTVNTVNIACSDENIGSILLKNIKGGTLSTGAASSIIASIDSGATYQDVTGDSIRFEGLAAGEYTILLKYGRSLTCSTLPQLVTITRSSVLFTVDTKAATCGEPNGIAKAVVVGKSDGYSYSLSPTTGFRSSPIFAELKPGTYTMYIRTGETDLCPNQKVFKILGPDQLTYTFDKNNSCEGDGDSGNIIFEINGGVMPYKISSDNGATFTDDIYESRYVYRGQKTRDTGMKPGDYQFVITDGRGCSTLPVPVKIEESRIRARMRVEASKVETPTGQVLVYDLRGGTPTYQVSVDGGQTWGEVHSAKLDTLITGLAIGTYTLAVKDENECIKYFPFTIKESKFEIPNIFTPNGDTYNDVFQINNLPDGSYVTIVNRWGKVVYTSSNYQNDWDGEGLSDGIYFYSVNVPSKGVFKGWVEIKRQYQP